MLSPRSATKLLALGVIFLSGCGSTAILSTAIVPQRGPRIGGRVRGGQQPLAGATLQLYAVGTAGERSAAAPLLSRPVTSAEDGSFSITGLYQCQPSDFVYLTASGGNPGLGTGFSNPNAVLITAIGPCGNLTGSLTILVNEASTVAAVYALAPFMASPSAIGYSPANQSAIADAFNLASQLVDTSSGTAPGQHIPTGFTDPVMRINTLANILAICVNSAGGSSGDGSPCGTLFALTNSSAADTASALLAVAENPSRNAASLFRLPSPSSPFQPSESIPPADFSVALLPTSATSILPGANVQIPFTEGSGSVAHDLQLQPADAYTSVASAGASTNVTLPSCIGFSSTTPFVINNASPVASVTLLPPAGQTLNGGSSPVAIPNLAAMTALSLPLPPSTGGCAWVVH